jgi:hypothetical protein
MSSQEAVLQFSAASAGCCCSSSFLCLILMHCLPSELVHPRFSHFPPFLAFSLLPSSVPPSPSLPPSFLPSLPPTPVLLPFIATITNFLSSLANQLPVLVLILSFLTPYTLAHRSLAAWPVSLLAAAATFGETGRLSKIRSQSLHERLPRKK